MNKRRDRRDGRRGDRFEDERRRADKFEVDHAKIEEIEIPDKIKEKYRDDKIRDYKRKGIGINKCYDCCKSLGVNDAVKVSGNGWNRCEDCYYVVRLHNDPNYKKEKGEKVLEKGFSWKSRKDSEIENYKLVPVDFED